MIHEVFAATSAELDQAVHWRGLREPPPPPAPKKRWWSRPEPAAPPSEIAQLDVPVVEVGAILDVELATLEALLHGEPLDDIDAIVGLIQDPIVGEPPDAYEMFIAPVSERLVTALVQADRAQLESVVAVWVTTEEMQKSGWTESDALDVVLSVADFCKQARASGRDVFRLFSL